MPTSTDDKLKHLGNIELFRHCSRKDLEAVAAITEERALDAGAVVCGPGRVATQGFIVLDAWPGPCSSCSAGASATSSTAGAVCRPATEQPATDGPPVRAAHAGGISISPLATAATRPATRHSTATPPRVTTVPWSTESRPISAP
jgi:hypothetical protein